MVPEAQPRMLTLEELNNMGCEPIVEVNSAKKELKRGASNKIKKKRSVISKASIKKINDGGSYPGDVVFSPGDKKVSTKLHSSTMKKSNTLTTSIQTRAAGSMSSSNRFLFRGNEDFHHTSGRGSNFREQQESQNPQLYVGSAKSKTLPKQRR